MKSSTLLSLVGVAVIMLVIGVALGSVAFPTTKTETTTKTNTNSSPTVSTDCTQSGPIGTLRVDVVSSSANSSIIGAKISGFVSVICGYGEFPNTTIVEMPITPVFTPANGTVTNFSPQEVGNYSLTISYSNQTYPVLASVMPQEITIVTLGIPSGRINVTTVECYPLYLRDCGHETSA